MTFSANYSYVCLYKAQTSARDNAQNLLFIYLLQTLYLQAGVHTHTQDKTSNSRYNWAEIGSPDKAPRLPEDRNKSNYEMQIVSTAVLFLILFNKGKSLPLHLLLQPCIMSCSGESPPDPWHRIFPLIKSCLQQIQSEIHTLQFGGVQGLSALKNYSRALASGCR